MNRRSHSYLVLRVDGHEYRVAAPLGDRTVVRQAAAMAARFGYELNLAGRRGPEWPLSATLFTGQTLGGMFGRSGAQIHVYPARKVTR